MTTSEAKRTIMQRSLEIKTRMTVPLQFPVSIPGEGEPVCELTIKRPDVGLIADFILLIGGEEIFEALSALLFRGGLQDIIAQTNAGNRKAAEKALAEKLGQPDLAGLAKKLGAMITADRFDQAFELLGKACDEPAEVTRCLAPEDLWNILTEAAPVFFPKAFAPMQDDGEA